MRSISHHITPLVICGLGCGHTHTHTHTHTCIPTIRTGSILINQVRAGHRLEHAWFKNFKTHPYLVRWLASLPAVRPTSSRRIGPGFSHNAEYWHTKTDLLFQLRIIHCTMVSPFILLCFPFSLTGEQKSESLKRYQWIVQLMPITSH